MFLQIPSFLDSVSHCCLDLIRVMSRFCRKGKNCMLPLVISVYFISYGIF